MTDLVLLIIVWHVIYMALIHENWRVVADHSARACEEHATRGEYFAAVHVYSHGSMISFHPSKGQFMRWPEDMES